jgi:hypothetical protein
MVYKCCVQRHSNTGSISISARKPISPPPSKNEIYLPPVCRYLPTSRTLSAIIFCPLCMILPQFYLYLSSFFLFIVRDSADLKNKRKRLHGSHGLFLTFLILYSLLLTLLAQPGLINLTLLDSIISQLGGRFSSVSSRTIVLILFLYPLLNPVVRPPLTSLWSS